MKSNKKRTFYKIFLWHHLPWMDGQCAHTYNVHNAYLLELYEHSLDIGSPRAGTWCSQLLLKVLWSEMISIKRRLFYLKYTYNFILLFIVVFFISFVVVVDQRLIYRDRLAGDFRWIFQNIPMLLNNCKTNRLLQSTRTVVL